MASTTRQHPASEMLSKQELRVPRPGAIITVKGVGGPLLVENITLNGRNMILTAIDSEARRVQFRGPPSHYSIQIHEPKTPLGPHGK
ncbi:MAG: hypothetical protein OXE93_04420 [bacterium]|nr:hypothetical protein [bacterium]